MVRTSRCGRDNPGSNPGHGKFFFFFFHLLFWMLRGVGAFLFVCLLLLIFNLFLIKQLTRVSVFSVFVLGHFFIIIIIIKSNNFTNRALIARCMCNWQVKVSIHQHIGMWKKNSAEENGWLLLHIISFQLDQPQPHPFFFFFFNQVWAVCAH